MPKRAQNIIPQNQTEYEKVVRYSASMKYLAGSVDRRGSVELGI